MSLRHFNQVVAALNREIKKIEGRTQQGLIRAAIVIHRDTEDTAPITPLDVGNLRASFFYVTPQMSFTFGTFSRGPGLAGTIISQDRLAKLNADHARLLTVSKGVAAAFSGPAVILGYSAYYAAIVHEMVGVNWTRPGSGRWWFKASFQRNKQKVLKIIRDNARIPL